MSPYQNGDWLNASRRRLPYRPPTVDEALPFSPFTSVIPFSPDIIPLPAPTPPSPPTTLSSEQQYAALRTIGRLNEKIKQLPATAQQLEDTFSQLRDLLGDPDDMTEFCFKATPQSDRASNSNGVAPSPALALSPFAQMLLGHSNVPYTQSGDRPVQRVKVKPELQRRLGGQTPNRPNKANVQSIEPAFTTNGSAPKTNDTPSSGDAGGTPGKHLSIVVQALPANTPKEDYRRYEHLPDPGRQDAGHTPRENALALLKPQEREVAENKILSFQKLLQNLSKERDDLDNSERFLKVVCLDSDITVMAPKTLSHLYDRVMAVCATGCFDSVSVESVMSLHSLCEPSITAADQSVQFNPDDFDSWIADLSTIESGLRASKLVLTAMLQGSEDRRVSPEDLIITIVEVLKRALDLCVLPLLHTRRSDEASNLFEQAYAEREKIVPVMRLCTSVMQHLASLTGKIALSEAALNPLEHIALGLVVHQNSESEKDSILGMQRFENLRRAAMEVLSEVFASHRDHQHYITTEILNSLGELREKGANARQFKSPRDPPIMPVSALFMRFTQVAATHQESRGRPVESSEALRRPQQSDDDDDSDYDSEASPSKKATKKININSSSSTMAHQLLGNARGIAHRITSTLTDRALNVTKSDEKPFRNLLDMFVEDLCNVLGSPEWPAASMLLYLLLVDMSKLIKAQNNRDMALAIMGSMGCGIIDFKLRVKHLKREIDVTQGELSSSLDQWAEAALGSGIGKQMLLDFKGPYRMAIESISDYPTTSATQEEPHLKSVRGCYLALWLDAVTRENAACQKQERAEQVMIDTQKSLETMISDSTWISRDYKYQKISDSQSRLAAGVITLQETFCQYLPRIINVMLQHTREGGANSKSRAIKNIEAFLDKDAQSMPEQLVMGIISLLRDSSPLVRSDAVSLVAKCLERNADLESHCIQGILSLTIDPSNGPKKKALNLLKKLYHISTIADHKLMIVSSLLLPSQDHEKPIADMATQALEDIWLKSTDEKSQPDASRLKLLRSERASLLVQIVRRIQQLPASLDAFAKFFSNALSKVSDSAASVQICKDVVIDIIEGVISPESMAVGCTQESSLQTLSIFARVRPGLFNLDQLQLLKLYIKNPTTVDDLNVLRPTAMIFRSVLPRLPNVQSDIADEIWVLLSQVMSKLASWSARGNAVGKMTLSDVIQCAWMISPLAKSGVQRLFKITTSTLVQLQPLAGLSVETVAPAKSKIMSYLILIGTLGKFCHFDGHANIFRWSLSDTVKKFLDGKKVTREQLAGLAKVVEKSTTDKKSPEQTPSATLLDTVRSFTRQTWDLDIREQALCSIGEICQGSQGLFTRPDVDMIFKLVFKNDVSSLKLVALTQFRDFFIKAERRSEGEAHDANEKTERTSSDKLGTTFETSNSQIAANQLARTFLEDVVDVALHTTDELAFMATKVIISISRQGLVHPKECGPALVALGTSPNQEIAEIAAEEHRNVHEAHESMFEKEYMAAVRLTFDYQQTVCHDCHGMIASTYKPKMIHVFNVMKAGARKYLKKFADNFCKQVDFELDKLGDEDTGTKFVHYVQFCLEHIALFDVPKLEDVAGLTNGLENIVLKLSGPSVGVVIETEMSFNAAPQPHLPAQPNGVFQSEHIEPMVAVPEQTIADHRLTQIARACVILQMIWETRLFIRKAYNLQNLSGRIQSKDYQKPALRNNLVSGKELWERLETILQSLKDRDTMLQQCLDFAQFLEVDRDAQIGDEEADGEDAAGYATPEENEDAMPMPTSGRGRKRKYPSSNGSTPKKARGRPSGARSRKRSSKTPEADGWD